MKHKKKKRKLSITASPVSYFEAAMRYGELTPAWTAAIFYTRTKRLGEQ